MNTLQKVTAGALLALTIVTFGAPRVDAATPTCSYSFVTNLKIGSRGQAVRDLQQFLNMDVETRIALTGAGSKGQETDYYGNLTAQAVSRFQEKYASSVLAPHGLTRGTGFWGASSRAKADLICKTPVVTPAPTPNPGSGMQNSEASLENFDVKGSPNNEDVEEGGDSTDVYSAEFDVEDGDIKLERVYARFEAASSTPEDEPWKLLDEVTLYANSEEIETVDASRESNWRRQASTFSPTNTRAYELRFTGLNDRFDEGDNVELTIAVTAQGNIDSDDIAQNFRVWIPENGIRAIDGAKINQYAGDDSDYTTFGFEEVGSGEELKIALSKNNPDESIIRVSENNTSNGAEILAFTLEAEDNDITINEIPVVLTFGQAVTFDRVVENAWIEIDGEEYSDFDVTPTSGTSTSFTLTFDLSDEDFVIAEGDKVEAVVVIEFNEQGNNEANYENGLTLSASVEADSIDAEGADDLTASNLNGSAEGSDHTLLARGTFAEVVSTFADDEDTSQGSGGERGNYRVTFEVTAFEDDFYVPFGATRGTSVAGEGLNYVIEDADGTVVSNGTTTDSFSSTARRLGNFFIVREGTTERLTLNVNFEPETDGFYRLRVFSVNYDDEASTASLASHRVSPSVDFQTDFVNLDA